MIYNYFSSGKIKVGGCAKTQRSIYVHYKWGENSIVYLKYKAQKGILEKIAIKRVILNSGPKTYNKIISIYQDTLNSLYNESDLITETEARSLAITYWETQEAEIKRNQCKINR
jgi:AAA+ ATPase superfamily predicted ATPase